MPYFDPDGGATLRIAFDSLVADWPKVTARTMFGCPSYQADGTLFAVLVTEGVALTRPPDDRWESLAEQFETGPFDAGGRTMTKWVQVPIDEVDELETLRPFVAASYESALAG